MKKFIIFFVLILTFFYVKTEAKEKLYIPYFDLINIHYDYQETISKLLNGYNSSSALYNFIFPDLPDSNFKYPIEREIINQAIKADCKYYLLSSFLRTGEKVIITLTMKETNTKKIVWGDKISIQNPEELDLLASSIAKSIGTNNKVTYFYPKSALNSKVDNFENIYSNGFSFGFNVGNINILKSHPISDVASLFGGGIIWTYNSQQFIFDISGNYYASGDRDYYTDAFLGIKFPIASKDYSIFGGFEIGSSYTQVVYELENFKYSVDNSGFFVGVCAGSKIYSSNNFSLRLEAKYKLGIYPLTDYNNSNLESKVHIFNLGLVIYFGR